MMLIQTKGDAGLGPRIEVACLSHSPAMTNDPAGAQEFRRAGARVAAAAAAFAPDLVVYFGPDHRRAMTELLPCFTIAEAAQGFGDWETSTQDYDVPADHAQALGKFLLDADIDIAMAGNLRLDHGFSLTMEQVFGSLGKVPVIPVVINCIGQPMARMRRVAALGSAVGDYLRQTLSNGEKVLILGSGGLSHSPPNLEPGFSDATPEQRKLMMLAARDGVAEQWDGDFLRRLENDWEGLATLDDAVLARGGTGGAEIRTWVAATFAGRAALETLAYEPVPGWFTGMGVAATRTLGA